MVTPFAWRFQGLSLWWSETSANSWFPMWSTGSDSFAWLTAPSDGASGVWSGVVVLLPLRSCRKPQKAPPQGWCVRLPGRGSWWVGLWVPCPGCVSADVCYRGKFAIKLGDNSNDKLVELVAGETSLTKPGHTSTRLPVLEHSVQQLLVTARSVDDNISFSLTVYLFCVALSFLERHAMR